MSARIFQKRRVNGVTEDQWRRLEHFFAMARNAMPHEIGNVTGMDYVVANAIVQAFDTDGVAVAYWLFYHRCSEAPVGARPMREGLQSFPWTCPECGTEVQSENELSYGVMCKTMAPVRFE